MRFRFLSPWLAGILLFTFSTPALADGSKAQNRDLVHGISWLFKKIGKGVRYYADSFKDPVKQSPATVGALDSGVRDVTLASGRKAKEFHCKIPDGYGKKGPESLALKTDEELPPDVAPPPPPPDLCLTDPAKYYQDQAGWLYDQSVIEPQKNGRAAAPSADAQVRLEGTRDVALKGTPEELRIFQRLLTAGAKDGKKPRLEGAGSWPVSAEKCSEHDPLCSLTNLFDLSGECTGDKPCTGRESAYLAFNMAKTTQYFPTLTQWYPAKGPAGEDWNQKWEIETLRSMSHVFEMLPKSSARFPVDKDFRKFPPGTVIGNCPSGGPCKPRESWPVPEGGGSSTIGMAQIFFFGDASESKPAGYSDSYILVTDKLVNANRMVTCKGLVHELTHHFDYSFMFDTADLNRTSRDSRQTALDRLTRDWGVKGFGKYSSLPVADVSGAASSFADLSWSCQRPGEGCGVKANESAGFVSEYAHQVGPMDDFAESVANYVCDPVELMLRSPAKYTWLKTRLFADRSAARATPREFWVPEHENWPGFDQALKTAASGSSGSDGLLVSCLNSFTQLQAQGFSWTSGPQAGSSFSKIAAFYPDPDPARRQQGMLKGYFVQDVLSQYNCVEPIANQIDSDIRSGMSSHSRPDDKYCAMGSQEAVKYLTAKRAGYVVTPFLQALANVGMKDKDGTFFQSLSACQAENRDSCAFLKAFNQELDTFGDALVSSGLTPQGRTKGVAKVLSLIRNGS